VGESGVTLSGGQKARLCLARACYQNKSLYLLDDPLSAVDTHVAKHIYDHCINGLLANKTRILSTHHLKFLLNADSVLVIDHNTIVRQGSAREIIPEYMQMFSLLKISDNDENEINEENTNDKSEEDVIDASSQADKIETALKAKDELDEIEIKENDEEEKEHGVISWRVYKYYCLSIGIFLTLVVFLSLFAMQGVFV
jgi:ATP-binding cassette subfamily C (CFTR/MRP) protein 10